MRATTPGVRLIPIAHAAIPGPVATVVIPEPNLHKLNLRLKPGGAVLGTVPEGAEVTVVGPCGSEAAAGFAKSTKPLGGGAAGWCQLMRRPAAA